MTAPTIHRPEVLASFHAVTPAPQRAPSGRPPARATEPSSGDAHLVRLALDLQVDALLTTIAAAASTHDESVPWRRWAVEDLDAARVLARAVASGDPQPTMLASARLGVEERVALSDLIARYESMAELLAGALAGRPGEPGLRRAARDARGRCHARLEELHRCLGQVLAREPGRHEHVVLPGEMLG